jgi:hypothetical protein
MWVGGQRHVPAALLQEKKLRTHFIEGWVGSRLGLIIIIIIIIIKLLAYFDG